MRFIRSNRGATGVFWQMRCVVYFRCGAKVTDASSKMDVPRLKMGDLLIQILVHFGLLGIVFLVPGRS